ncbi:MAG: CHRD domain-containing protein [Gammaproteobacteria bacterium]
MSSASRTVLLCAGLLALPAAADGNHGLTVSTRLVSYQEVPSVSSPARGRFRASIDEKAGTISYELSFSGLTGDIRQAHIHFGQRSVNGGVSVFPCQTATNPDPTGLAPQCPQSGTVTGLLQAANTIGPAGQGIAAGEFAELLAAIRAGVAYVNVHSSTFPGGEVRGQLRGHSD